MAGLWEQTWLWFIPFGVAAFLTLVLFITSLCMCVLGPGYAWSQKTCSKAHKVTKVAILNYVLLLAFLVFVFFVRIAHCAFDQHRFDYWVHDTLGSPCTLRHFHPTCFTSCNPFTHLSYRDDSIRQFSIQPHPTYLSTLKICRVELCTELFYAIIPILFLRFLLICYPYVLLHF